MMIYLMPSCACAWYCSAVLDFSLIQIFNLNSITFLILHIIQHTSLYFPKYLILITFSNVYLRCWRAKKVLVFLILLLIYLYICHPLLAVCAEILLVI